MIYSELTKKLLIFPSDSLRIYCGNWEDEKSGNALLHYTRLCLIKDPIPHSRILFPFYKGRESSKMITVIRVEQPEFRAGHNSSRASRLVSLNRAKIFVQTRLV